MHKTILNDFLAAAADALHIDIELLKEIKSDVTCFLIFFTALEQVQRCF